MMTCKKLIKYSVVLFICLFSFNAFCADKAAKEETSPPPEDGPLTAEQVPPINQ